MNWAPLMWFHICPDVMAKMMTCCCGVTSTHKELHVMNLNFELNECEKVRVHYYGNGSPRRLVIQKFQTVPLDVDHHTHQGKNHSHQQSPKVVWRTKDANLKNSVRKFMENLKRVMPPKMSVVVKVGALTETSVLSLIQRTITSPEKPTLLQWVVKCVNLYLYISLNVCMCVCVCVCVYAPINVQSVSLLGLALGRPMHDQGNRVDLKLKCHMKEYIEKALVKVSKLRMK